MTKFWRVLEELLGPSGVASLWERRVGAEFAVAKGAFLQARTKAAVSLPCPYECGCAHAAVRHDDGRIVAVCQCDPWNCDDIPLIEADLVVYELSWSKLGRAVASALGCEPKTDTLGIPGTKQVAAFGASALPVFLTIQTEPSAFRNAVAELAARLRGPFILFAPTSRFVDGTCKEFLANCRAGFFDLESHISVLPSGRLQAARSGGELFAAYLPEKGESIREAEAARVFRLFSGLLAMGTNLKAAPARVFDQMVFQKKTKAETAVACKCAASLITKRVALIEGHFRLPIEKLLAFASDIKERQTTVKGDRYARKKQGAAQDDPQQYDDGNQPNAKEDDDGYLPEERPDYG